MTRSRRGFSVLEIITALTIVAVLGVSMTKLIIGQARSFQMDSGGRRARSAARSAMNILITDLRMTQDNGGVALLDATNNRRIDVRVPLVFGVVCEVNPGSAVLSIVPVDSFQMAAAKYGGYAVRTNAATGIFSYTTPTSADTIQSVDRSRCRGGVNMYADTITSNGRIGKVVLVTPAPPAGTAVGHLAFIWQTVTYEFKTSTMYPGTYGLYRVIRGRANTDTLSEELLAPFASSARFSYYMTPSLTRDTAQTTTPAAADYNRIRGFRIRLPAVVTDTVPGRKTPQSATVTTAVFFKNSRNQ